MDKELMKASKRLGGHRPRDRKIDELRRNKETETNGHTHPYRLEKGQRQTHGQLANRSCGSPQAPTWGSRPAQLEMEQLPALQENGEDSHPEHIVLQEGRCGQCCLRLWRLLLSGAWPWGSRQDRNSSHLWARGRGAGL